MLHDRPVCYRCQDVIPHDWVYAAPCGCPQCPSAVFHGLCLMEWRERYKVKYRDVNTWVAAHMALLAEIQRKGNRD